MSLEGSVNLARRWWLRSLVRAVAVVALVTVAVFFLIRLVPGDPVKMILGQYATDAAIQAMHARLGLDLPLGDQFLRFVGQVFTSGDTGTSVVYNVSTRDLIVARAPVTLVLIGLATVLTVVLSLVLATLAATHKDRPLDHAIRVLPAITLGMPVFWVGLLFILLFSVQWRLFPVGGVGEGPLGLVYGLTLPAVTVALAQTPSLVRSLRAQILEVLESDFVMTLRASGLPPRTILYRHVLRNSAVPALMLWGVNIAYLMGGTLVIEQVFGLKGVGSLLFGAISNRDFPLIQGVALYCAVAVVFVGLVTEALAGWLDPRTRGQP
jgi:peptide/nickel transport system permease protein